MQTDRQICFVSLDDDFSQEAYDETGIGHCLVRTRYFCHTMEEGGLQEEHVRQALQKLENQRCSFQKCVSHSTHTPVFLDRQSATDKLVIYLQESVSIIILKKIKGVEERAPLRTGGFL